MSADANEPKSPVRLLALIAGFNHRRDPDVHGPGPGSVGEHSNEGAEHHDRSAAPARDHEPEFDAPGGNKRFVLRGESLRRWRHQALHLGDRRGSAAAGLNLSGDRIQGTPTTAGTFTFTARVRDSGGQDASREFSITVT